MANNEHSEYLDRKLAHYNVWLLDPKREFGVPYKGFPEDLIKTKGKKMQSNVIADMTQVLSGTKAPVAASKAKAVKAKTAKKSDGPRAGSKGDMALAIYKRLNGDKTSVISAIQTEIGMSAAGATTYFYNAKKLA